MSDEPETSDPPPNPNGPNPAYFPAFTPSMPPPLIGSGNFIISPLIITQGGIQGPPLLQQAADNPALFPAYTTAQPPDPANPPIPTGGETVTAARSETSEPETLEPEDDMSDAPRTAKNRRGRRR